VPPPLEVLGGAQPNHMIAVGELIAKRGLQSGRIEGADRTAHLYSCHTVFVVRLHPFIDGTALSLMVRKRNHHAI
jgi:hypothetical protein